MADRRVALITGASRGIGRAIAVELARNGFDVAGNGTARSDALAAAGAAVEEAGGAFLPVVADIAKLDGHEALVGSVLDRFGRIDFLVNNAGVAPPERPDILETTAEIYDHVFGVNTRGTFFLTQRVARRMIEQTKTRPDPRPAIVFITSVSVYMTSTPRAEYCMSKAATSHGAAVFAHRLAEHGINVYEVRPGITRTDMTAPAADMYDRRIKEGLIPQNRWGLPDDVGRAVASLACGDFAYSTGMVVDVSGGMNLQRL